MEYGVLSVTLIVVVMLYELKRKSISIFLWVSILMFFCFGHISFMLFEGYNPKVIDKASWFVTLFCLVYLLSRIALNRVSNNEIILVEDNTGEEVCSNDNRFAEICFYSLLICTLIYCISLYGYTGALFDISKSQVYSFRYSNKWVLITNYGWSIGVPTFLWYLLHGNKLRTIISAVSILSMSFFSGTRTQLVVLFVMIALYYLYHERRIKLRSYIMLICFALIGIYFMLALRAFRYDYSFADLSTISIEDINRVIMRLDSQKSGDLYLCNFFYGIIDIDNNFDGLGYGAGWIRLLLLPFPSALCLGLKPKDICLTLGLLFGGGNTINYSVTPTLFGDCYANLGMVGIFLGIPWAIIIYILEKLCARKTCCLRVFFSVTVAWALINIGRGDVYNALAGIYYSIILYWIIMIYIINVKPVRFVLGKQRDWS